MRKILVAVLLSFVFAVVFTSFVLAQETPPATGGEGGTGMTTPTEPTAPPVPPSGEGGGAPPTPYPGEMPPSGEGAAGGGAGTIPSGEVYPIPPSGEGGYPMPSGEGGGGIPTMPSGEGGGMPPSGAGGPGGCIIAEECTAYCTSHPEEAGCGMGGGGGGMPGGEAGVPMPSGEGGWGAGVPMPSGGVMPSIPGGEGAVPSPPPSIGGGMPPISGGMPASSPRERPKRTPRKPEGKGPPTTIPPEVKGAGASQEFIDMMCSMARFNSQKFVLATEVAEQHFMQLSGDLEIDASKLQALRERIQGRAGDVCNANEANFGSAITAFMNEMEGPEGMEAAMNDVGNQIESQMQAKVEAMQQEMQPRIERMQEIRQQTEEINAMQKDIAAAGASAEALQVYEEQKRPLYEEMQQIGVEMQAQGMQMQELGTKLESVFGGLEQEMTANFDENSGEFMAFKMEMAEKQMALFTKVFDVQIEKIRTKKQVLEEEGVDASVFDELIAWMESKKTEAQSVFYSGDEAAMEKFMNEMQGSRSTWEARIDEAISPQIEAKIEGKWSETKPKIEEGIALAKENNIDTTDIERIVSDLEALQADYKTLQGEQKMAAYGKAKQKFEELREYWIVLRDELEAVASERMLESG